MASGLRQLPGRVRRRVRRMADEAVLRRFDFDLPPGRTVLLVADADARSALPETLRAVPHGQAAGAVTVLDLHVPEALPVRAEGRWDSVVLLASDRSDLRRVLPVLPRLGLVDQVAVWLTGTRVPLGLVPRPEWPALAELESRCLSVSRPGVVLRARFSRRAKARTVLREVATQCAPVPGGDAGLRTGYLGRVPEAGLDLSARLFERAVDALEHEMTVPMDLLLAPSGAQGLDAELAPGHHVLDRAPVVVTETAVGPVDETVFNPVRWTKHPAGGAVDLHDLVARSGHVTEHTVHRARKHRSVTVDLATADVQDVLRLAMAGTPLVPVGLDAARASGRLAGVSAQVLHELSLAASGGPVDLTDALEREEYSLRLRRATFDAHSTLAHRAGRAGLAGVDRMRTATVGLPGVSIVLATRREHELPNAVANVRKQVGAEIELVVAAHGFTPDEATLRTQLGDEHGLVVLSFETTTRFGDVLTAAAQAASHDVVMKMDDDDWYSPHAVHDLLMARRYSGADLVGMPTEFVHLQVFDQTVWRREPAETFTSHVAGGTMTVSRDLLREVGWFRPVLRWVDAQLLGAVAAAGGSTYRTHGLGYVLVRREEGHTWTMDPEAFRTADAVERIFEGFHTPGQAPGHDHGTAPVRSSGAVAAGGAA